MFLDSSVDLWNLDVFYRAILEEKNNEKKESQCDIIVEQQFE